MKYIIPALLLLSSCTTPRQQYNDDIRKHKAVQGVSGDTFYVITVDSCEYVVYHGSQKGSIVHKANCINHKTK
jgi:hypothetical protein